MPPATIEAGGVAGDKTEDYYAEVRAWRDAHETPTAAAKVAALEALRQKLNEASEMKDACPVTQASSPIVQSGASATSRGSFKIPGEKVQSVVTDHLGRDSPLRCVALCVPLPLPFSHFALQVAAQVWNDTDMLLGRYSRGRPEVSRRSAPGVFS